MTAAEVEQALRLAADERERYGRLVLDLIERGPEPGFDWRDQRRAAIESHWDAFERSNALLAAFLGARVGRLTGVWYADLSDDVRLDHHVALYVGRNLLGFISHPYGYDGVLVAETCEFRARQLAVPSWWHPAARVFILMAPDAPQWERLTPLLAREVRS